MGDPKFSRRKYDTPAHPWEGDRIKEENELLMKYGLKNKEELWRAKSYVRALRSQSKDLQARTRIGDPQAKIGVVVINEARKVVFESGEEQVVPMVWAESGANFGMIARLAAQRGLSGLEWAAGIPGTVGGAVFGNAGAHGSELAGNLVMAEILQQANHEQRERWNCEEFAFTYRSSILKTSRMKSIRTPDVVVLSVQLSLKRNSPEAIQLLMDEYLSFRRRTQPPGASMGSMFKNPPGDFAGRLIEATGLKGTRNGQAEISQLHGNFFINHGGASANEIYELIQLARKAVLDKFQIFLELEI